MSQPSPTALQPGSDAFKSRLFIGFTHVVASPENPFIAV